MCVIFKKNLLFFLFVLYFAGFVKAEVFIEPANITTTAHSVTIPHYSYLTSNRSGLDSHDIHHSSQASGTWLSQQFPIGTANPSPAGTTGTGWIAYYFDKAYLLGDMWVWNYNVSGLTTRGFRKADVYYRDSDDVWKYWGEYEFSKASGSDLYTCKDIIDFDGLEASGVAIVAQSSDGNWGANYVGLSEVKFFIFRPEVNLQSDTWVATDSLGRSLIGPQNSSPKREKYVGIFYFLWFGEHDLSGPYDISNIIEADPINPQFGPMGSYHFWGEPELGYYLSRDEYVLRKHAYMLSQAEVDVIIFDVTNNFTYQNNYMTLCSVYEQIRSEGGKTPQIAFLCSFYDPEVAVESIYDNLYSNGYYSDLWFHWKGKPLILADPEEISDPTIKNFFTFRKPQPSYFVGPTGPEQWGWLEVYPQHSYYKDLSKSEEVTVGIGQNAYSGYLTQMSDARGARGRSWHDGSKDTSAGAVNYGYNFQEQWERALAIDPEFIFITGWNEWVAFRQSESQSGNNPSYYPDAVFWDVYTQEYSRDIEPMEGGHTDNYYYQMINYIRQFKGIRDLPVPSKPTEINIDGDFSDWVNVRPVYRDNINDTIERNSAGWGVAGPYVNYTGRNDIISTKVARDENYLYFYVQTAENLTLYTGSNWMLLFIDIDQDSSTGWQGYDYLLNDDVFTSSRTTLKHTSAGWNWVTVNDNITYSVYHTQLEMAIPLDDLDQNSSNLMFDFHWADNIQRADDIIEFSISGDSAPDRRFNYRYDTTITALACGEVFEDGEGNNMDLDTDCDIDFDDLYLLVLDWIEVYDLLDFGDLSEDWLLEYTPAVYTRANFVEDFETGDFIKYDWQHNGSEDWTVESDSYYTGSYAAKSADISNNQSSQISINVELYADSQLSFFYRVSSENGYDFLKFYIDGIEKNSWSGNQSWQKQSYSLPAGVYTLEWKYQKDQSVSSYLDSCWIDDIIIMSLD